jgi:hypothetical protein
MTRDEAIAACEAASGTLWQVAGKVKPLPSKLRAQSLALGEVVRLLADEPEKRRK